MASHGDRFRRRALSRGYKVDEVDAFLDRVEATLAGEPVGSPVSADEVDDVVFRVRFGGYDEWQVDVYLDRVARQLAELEERGVLGTAPAPDYGKAEVSSVPAPPMQASPGARRAPEPQATQVIPAATQAIPAHEVMAAREMAPPPPAPEPVGRGRGAARAAAAPPDNEGFGDLRGGDDEGFGFLAGPPDEDYDDPFANRGGANRGGGQDFGRGGPGDFGPGQGEFGRGGQGEFGPGQGEFGRGQGEFAPPRDDFGQGEFGPGQGDFGGQRGPNGGNGFGPRGGAPEPGGFGNEYGAPRGPEPVRSDFAPPTQAVPRAGMPMHEGPQAGPNPHGATEQLPLQSDPRRGGFGQGDVPGGPFGQNDGPGGFAPGDAPGGFGPNDAPAFGPGDAQGVYGQGRRSAPEPAPGFGAAYDDEFSDTGSRRGMPQQPPMPQPPMPGGQQGPPSGAIPQAGRYNQPEPEPMPPAAPTQAIPQSLVNGMGQNPMGRPEPHQSDPYGAPRGREYGQGGFGQQPQEDTGYGRRAAAPSPPMQQGFDRGPQQHEPTGGFGAPAGPPPGPAEGGFGQQPPLPADPAGFGQQPPPPADPAGFGQPGAPRGTATPPDFGRRNPYEGRGFEAPGRHGREEMTTEMRASDSPFTPDDVQRLEQMRRAFQPRRFGSGYDPGQVDQMFDAVSAAMTGRNPVPLSDRELDTSQFSLVQGGYFEAEVDSALREVREMFARRGMMH
ncbi:DivIVA domain-containing protein [Glycomyces luteolus]|uniref:DivIVA domain-containing protein n=1 Tax=Glycomyces luteolus TaxID=2670330 RepID=A0A9X3PDJ0_9ACTN|nr:DivIVA domain-containing protein [Glycomyces luteolus]MDA1362056.1 DivIVA domain-containing protein [Glycomyces luteolus]